MTTSNKRAYRDLREHIELLDKKGLLVTIDKDSEMHPLVRWQFRGGIAEKDRKAFLFNNIVNAKGRRYEIPVVVCAIAASQEIYSTGMDAPVEAMGEKWSRAIENPVAPNFVETAPCQEVVRQGDDLLGNGKGLDALPIPVSTPGFDSAPTLSAPNVISRYPETGVQNMGTYRAGLKAPNRLVVRMATRAGGYVHWQKHKARGDKMPCAIVLGCPPYVAFMEPQKLPIDMDEFGALAYRHSPAEDVVILPHRGMGHGPKREHGNEEDSTLLIDATMKNAMPPLALPGKEYMEHAKALWERLDLPTLRPESPWHGYSLGDWTETWSKAAQKAALGDYLENGEQTLARQQRDLIPETSVRDIEEGWD